MSDPEQQPVSADDSERDGRLDRRVLAGIVALTLAASAALFGLPALRATGMSFDEAFWTLAAIELVAALGIVALVFYLTDGSDER